MQEKIKTYWTQGLARWKAAKKRTKLLLGAGLLGVLVIIGIVVAMGMNQPYVTLFTKLNQSDMTAIVNLLAENGVSDYRINGTDTILVPESQADRLKMQIFSQGYPSSGFHYGTYLDNVGSLTTESERVQLRLFELQDRNAAIIRYMDGIQDAFVNITPGEDRTYVLDSKNALKASAAVMVVMEDGKMLTDSQVTVIKNIISHSVQGLEIEEVSVSDSYGNHYTVNDTKGSVQDTSQLKLQLEQKVNNTIRTNIMQVLEPLYGLNNIRVSVNSIVDVDRSYTDSVDYSLEDWAADGSTNGEGIIGQKIYDQEVVRDTENPPGGVAGTETNADIPTYGNELPPTTGNETSISSSGQKNYLVDQENRRVEHIAGTVSDVMVSVTINQSVAGQIDINALYAHVGRASGIGVDVQQDKINILIAPFYQETPIDEVIAEGGVSWILYAAIGGLALFAVLLLLILLLRRKRKKKRGKKGQEGLEQPDQAVAVAAAAGADIMEITTERSMELRKDVRKFAEENPEIAAQMVKTWLKEGDGAE